LNRRDADIAEKNMRARKRTFEQEDLRKPQAFLGVLGDLGGEWFQP
jgi:hypothetical protein